MVVLVLVPGLGLGTCPRVVDACPSRARIRGARGSINGIREMAGTPLGMLVGILCGVLACEVVFGGDLLSHTLASAVPSALAGLASGFGMGPGVSLPLWPP